MYKFDINRYKPNQVGYSDVVKYPGDQIDIEKNPHLYNFVFYGLYCKILRNHSGNWCGYVDCKHETDSDIINIHGGITCYQEENKKKRLGFDTCHFYDQRPEETTRRIEKTYKDYDYTVNELKFLALQVFIQLPKWSPFTHKYFPKSIQEEYVKIYMILRRFKQDKNIWLKIIGELFELKREQAKKIYAIYLKKWEKTRQLNRTHFILPDL